MRSLALKLTLAFLIVGLIGAAFVAVIVHQRTKVEFDRFVLNRNRSKLVEVLGDYYQARGSWKGVERLFRRLSNNSQLSDLEIQKLMQNLIISLAAPDGRVVFSTRGENVGRLLPARELEKATSIDVNNEIVGWLLLRSAPNLLVKGTPEGAFLANINRAILISALFAVLAALLAGGLMAYTLTRSLRELTVATRRVAEGELGYQVELHSNDELGDLAKSFNQMSQDLARSNQARRQMTADIAHDLRSPLSVILGYTEALSEGKIEGTLEVFDVLHQEAQHLSYLIDDLRTLSLADAGELSLNLQPVAPQELLQDVARSYQQQAQEKAIVLRVDASGNVPQVNVDPNRMTQVLSNLVSNALRYTPEGGEIVLGSSFTEDTVTLYVQDNGVGIKEKDLPHIFHRFYRGDNSRQHNGKTGLGLAIVKSLVEVQGGSVSVESTPGIRTIFNVRLHACLNQ